MVTAIRASSPFPISQPIGIPFFYFQDFSLSVYCPAKSLSISQPSFPLTLLWFRNLPAFSWFLLGGRSPLKSFMLPISLATPSFNSQLFFSLSFFPTPLVSISPLCKPFSGRFGRGARTLETTPPPPPPPPPLPAPPPPLFSDEEGVTRAHRFSVYSFARNSSSLPLFSPTRPPLSPCYSTFSYPLTATGILRPSFFVFFPPRLVPSTFHTCTPPFRCRRRRHYCSRALIGGLLYPCLSRVSTFRTIHYVFFCCAAFHASSPRKTAEPPIHKLQAPR